MAHQRFRRFNTGMYYKDQDIKNEMCMAVRAGNIVFLRGQTGFTLDGGFDGVGDPAAQADQAMKNVKVLLEEAGGASDGGPAPYLDARPATEDERALLAADLAAPWLSGEGLEGRALGHAIAHLVPAHLAEVRARRLAEIAKVEREVRARLTREINYWDARAARLREEERAGREQRVNAGNAEATAARMVERLHRRQAELELERQISAMPPVLKGVALVVPAGLLRLRAPAPAAAPPGVADTLSRVEVEKLAMEAVLATERALGHRPTDVSKENRGWDIESVDGRTGGLRFIEVKGRAEGGDVVMLTKNELLAALNSPDRFILAIVRVGAGFAMEPVYVRRFFERPLGFAETAVAFDVKELIAAGQLPG